MTLDLADVVQAGQEGGDLGCLSWLHVTLRRSHQQGPRVASWCIGKERAGKSFTYNTPLGLNLGPFVVPEGAININFGVFGCSLLHRLFIALNGKFISSH